MTLVSGSFITAHHKLLDSSWNIHYFFLSGRDRESKPPDSGCRGQHFHIQQPEIGKVRKNSAGITCSL